jgi:hypothetical protein
MNFTKTITVISAAWRYRDIISTAIDDNAEFQAAFSQFDWNNEHQTHQALQTIVSLPVLALAVKKTSTEWDNELLQNTQQLLSNEELFQLAWRISHGELTALELTKMLASGRWKTLIEKLPFAVCNAATTPQEEEQETEIGIITIMGIVSLSVQILRFLKEQKENNK